MPVPASTFGQVRTPIADKDGMVSWEWIKKFQEWEVKLNNAVTLLGEFASGANIQGRTEGIGTTVAQIDSGGIVLPAGVDFSRAYTNKDLSNVPDDIASDRRAATANQKTGGDNAFLGLNTLGDLSRDVVADRVIAASILAGAVTLAKQNADSLARMFTSDANRTNIELKEPAEVNSDRTSLHVGMSRVVGTTSNPSAMS